MPSTAADQRPPRTGTSPWRPSCADNVQDQNRPASSSPRPGALLLASPLATRPRARRVGAGVQEKPARGCPPASSPCSPRSGDETHPAISALQGGHPDTEMDQGPFPAAALSLPDKEVMGDPTTQGERKQGRLWT